MIYIINMAKRQLKKQINDLTEKILEQFQSQEEFSVFRRKLYGFTPNYPNMRVNVSNTLQRMKRQGWIEQKKIEDRLYYSLTAKGKVRLLMQKLRKQQRGTQSTILMFDIPESKRNFRDFLRRLLLKNGFIMLQKSVFVTPNVLPQEFYDLLRELDLLSFVMVIEGHLRFKK